MLRGTSIFYCDHCHKKFKGLDIEFQCTCLTSPQRCPYCGSYHTLPEDSLNHYRSLYEKIWKRMDETKEYHSACFIDPELYEKAADECEQWNNTPEDEREKKREPNNAPEDDSSKNGFQTFCEMSLVILVLMIFSAIEFLESLSDKIGRVFRRE